MNKREVIKKVAMESRIDEATCLQVIDTLEEVIGQEIFNSRRWNQFFEKAYGIMSSIHRTKEKKNI